MAQLSKKRLVLSEGGLSLPQQTLIGTDGKPIPKYIKKFPEDNRQDKCLCIYSPLAMESVPRLYFLSILKVIHPKMMVPIRNLGISDYFTHFPNTFPICKSRNLAVKFARENKADFIIMLDGDMLFPPDIIFKLATHKLPIVSGVYHHQSPPCLPVIYKKNYSKDRHFTHYWDYPRNELFDVDLVGAGCLWIDMRVFDEIEMPYFRYDSTKQDGTIDVTEDVEFCLKAKAAGFSIMVDPKIQCGHLKTEIKTQIDYDAYLQQYHDYQRLIEKFGDGSDLGAPK
jgi:glycosyltransferase involved in cell wall biosynthesis